MYTNQTILISGGTGSWGQELTKQLLEKQPKKIVIFSRGEISQVVMQRKFQDKRLEFVIGDIRDKDAVDSVFMKGIDYVFHLAALKHVPICERQPEEAIKTNIQGTTNLIQAAIKYKVKKFVDVSTDKAVDPINVYGMTKGIGERSVIQADRQTKDTDFLCIRGGNVLGTNGSLVPFLIDQIKTHNKVLITDTGMTRYFLTLEKAIHLLFFASERGRGGETYVMNMPSFYITDLVAILIDHYGNERTVKQVIGKREGEKIHEVLISPHEISRTQCVNSDYHVIYPQLDLNGVAFWDRELTNPIYSAFTSKEALQDKSVLQQLLKDGGFLQ